MNELYAADPAVCRHASELKLLLASFGPYAGRYLANYPLDWAAQVERQFDTLGEVEAARVKTLLRRAKDNLTLVTRANLPWRTEQAWLANAMPLLCNPPAVFDGLIASTTTTPAPTAAHTNSVDGLACPKPQALAIQPLDALDLPPTADERIAGIASEYARVAKILLLLSPEIALIDPYLNPLKRTYAVVLQALFDLAAKGKCQRITLWARSAEVLSGSASPAIKSDIEATLRRMAQQASFKPGRVVELLLADETCQNKLHDRYLLSIKGGIRIGQGFAQLPQGRQVDAGPVGKTIHNDLLDIHFDGKHDMRVADRITITV